MASIDWKLDFDELVTCNCDFSCPCQFNALPTHGDCRAAAAYRVTRGHFGDTALDGAVFAALWAWPGPIHEGGGEGQLIVDVRASEAQAQALHSLFMGEHTEPGATIFNVFSNVIDTYHPVLREPVDFQMDLDARTGRFAVPGIIEGSSAPITNPVSGAPHRARVTLPQGFEYHEAEYASCTVRTQDSVIALRYSNAHAHLAHVTWTPRGVVHA